VEGLDISRGSVYYLPLLVPEVGVAIMRRLVRLNLKLPLRWEPAGDQLTKIRDAVNDRLLRPSPRTERIPANAPDPRDSAAGVQNPVDQGERFPIALVRDISASSAPFRTICKPNVSKMPLTAFLQSFANLSTPVASDCRLLQPNFRRAHQSS